MSKKYMDGGHLLNILIALESRECSEARILGFIHNQQIAVVEYKNTNYYLWDNGGEMGVIKIKNELGEHIPLSAFSKPLNALTVAYRIGQVLNDKPIDYDFVYSDEESSAFLGGLGREEEMYKHMYGENNEEDDEEAEI